MPLTVDWLLADVVPRLSPVVAGLPRLNLGSGPDRRSGYVNLDRVAMPEVDVAGTLDPAALPFADGRFGLVLCVDVLEHVDVVPALREIHRVLAPGGVVVVSAVHFTSRNLYIDPTHVRGFSVRTFEFFAPSAGNRPRNWHRSYYFDFAFSRVDFTGVQFGSTLGKGRYLVWDRLLEPCVNWRPAVQDVYEMTFLSRLFPAANVLIAMTK